MRSVSGVVIELSAVIVALSDDAPTILLVPSEDVGAQGLPFGPFDPVGDRTLEEGLRRGVVQQAGLTLGYAEQLYTFGDRFRDPQERSGGPRPVSVGYLALARQGDDAPSPRESWTDWYRFLPWEDWRGGTPGLIDSVIVPRLEAWCAAATSKAEQQRRRDRTHLTFALGDATWDNERVLERYELLYEAQLVAESARDQGKPLLGVATGTPLAKDHRRILATAMGRLRAKIKYRPVIFELMPPAFTLLQLQRAAEALAGGRLHKQNFRRLVAHEGLVEPTGQISVQTGGRPAELFRFRRGVVLERPAPGVRLPVKRGGKSS